MQKEDLNTHEFQNKRTQTQTQIHKQLTNNTLHCTKMDKKEKKSSFSSNSKLLRVLKILTLKEIESLKDCLNSPFQKASPEETDLFNYLKPAFPEFDESRINKNDAFKILFPDIKFNNQKINKIAASLCYKIEQFLIHAAVEQDSFLKDRLLMKAYNQHNSYQSFAKIANKLNSSLEENKAKCLDDYIDLFLINKEVFFHPETEKYALKVESLEDLYTNLDLFYTSAKLQFGIEYLTRSKMLAIEPDKRRLSELRGITDKHSNSKFDIYHKIIQLIDKGHQDHLYQSLQLDIKKYLKILSNSERAFIYQFLINHFNILISSKGKTQYTNELFQLYKFGVEHELFIQNHRMSDLVFINVVVSACLAKEFKYAKKFVSFYSQYLSSQIKDNAIQLSHAYLFFHQNKLSEVNDLLINIPYSNLSYKLRGKSLLLRCSFKNYLKSKKNLIRFSSNANSFKRFIDRNSSIPENKKEGYFNLIRILRKLSNKVLANNRDKQKLKKELLKELSQIGALVAKNWVIQEINAFK